MIHLSKARNGKIARLPRGVREELNRRMREGERGTRLVVWLNTLPEVQRVIATEFGGRAVREQNLSEWRKRGGYREWVMCAEAGEAMRRLEQGDHQAGRPGEEVALAETLAQWVTARYAVAARWVDEAQGEERWNRLRKFSADVVALRRGDHRAQRIAWQRERMATRASLRRDAEGDGRDAHGPRGTSRVDAGASRRRGQRKSESIRVNPSEMQRPASAVGGLPEGTVGLHRRPAEDAPSMLSRALLPFLSVSTLLAANPTPTPAPAAKPTPVPGPPPTLAEVRYGDHERQVLDFYKAASDKPTPLLFYIHGGGWVAGDKKNPGSLQACLDAGISVVSINYRYSWQAQIDGVKPPVKAPLEDAARALQFVRSKAKEWNIDKQRIGASGGSAGACSSLWLAFHEDMADPKSSDPIARESTRLWCAAVNGAQTSLDPKQLVEWTPNSRYGGHAFGFMDPNDRKTRDTRFAEFLQHRDELLPLIKKYSPYELVSKGDPGVYLFYNNAPALGQTVKDPTHTANYGVKLQEHCKTLGVPCELVYPGAPNVQHASIDAYLIDTLKK